MKLFLVIDRLLERLDAFWLRCTAACVREIDEWIPQRALEWGLVALFASCCFSPGVLLPISLGSAILVTFAMWMQIDAFTPRPVQRRLPACRYFRVLITAMLVFYTVGNYFALSRAGFLYALVRNIDCVVFQYVVVTDRGNGSGRKRRELLAKLKNFTWVPVPPLIQPR